MDPLRSIERGIVLLLVAVLWMSLPKGHPVYLKDLQSPHRTRPDWLPAVGMGHRWWTASLAGRGGAVPYARWENAWMLLILAAYVGSACISLAIVGS